MKCICLALALMSFSLLLKSQPPGYILIKDNHGNITQINLNGGTYIGHLYLAQNKTSTPTNPKAANFKIVINTKSKVYSDNKLLGQSAVPNFLKVQFGKGQHRLLFQSVYYPDFKAEYLINVSDSLIGGEYYADYWFDINADLLPVKSNSSGKCKYLNVRTKEVNPGVEFDDAHSFYSGLAAVKKNGKWGYFDGQKPESVKYLYDRAFDFEGNIARVVVNGKFGIIDKSGNFVVTPKYDDIKEFERGFAQIGMNHPDSLVQTPGRGIIDTSGRVVVNPNYSSITKDQNDWYVTMDRLIPNYENGKVVSYHSKLTQGLVRNGVERIPAKYEQVMPYFGPERFDEGYLYLVRIGEKYFLMNDSGKLAETNRIQWHRVYPANNFQEGFVSQTPEGKEGYLSYLFKELIPPKYDLINPVRGVIMVDSAYKYALFDEKGKPITQFLYDDVHCEIYKRGKYLLRKNGILVVVDKNGNEPKIDYEILEPFKYDIERIRFDYPLRIFNNGKYGFLDDTTVVIPPTFDFAEGFLPGWNFTYVKVGAKYGILTRDKKVKMLPGNYSYASLLDKEVLLLETKEGTYNYFDGKGNCIYGCK